MKTATCMGRVNENKAAGTQYLWKLSEPMVWDWYDDKFRNTTNYIITSAASVPYSGPEVLIFASDEHGDMIDFLALPGSQLGTLDHKQVLRDAGWELATVAE